MSKTHRNGGSSRPEVEERSVPDQAVQVEAVQRPRQSARFAPAVDVWDAGQEWTLLADIPGADGSGIDVVYEDGVVTVTAAVPPRQHPGTQRRGEYGVGDYHRAFRIGEDIDAERISAEFDRGVLTLHLPKVASTQARKIPIATAERR
jgi:HSP20 family protein